MQGESEVGADEQFGDIEEALGELFGAKEILDSLGEPVVAEIAAVREKVARACHLLDRPWP